MPNFGILDRVKLGSILVMGALGLLILASCGGDGDTAEPTDTPTPTVESTTEVEPTTMVETVTTEGETVLTITTPGDDLKFDTDLMTVKVGTEVVLTYVNSSTVFQHNWVLVKAGTKDAVAADGGRVPENGYVPEGDDRVLAAIIPLVDPGEIREIRFAAPPVGQYDFVCTFPGHNATKFGMFDVTP